MLWDGQASSWEAMCDPGHLILASEPAHSQPGQVARGSCGPSPGQVSPCLEPASLPAGRLGPDLSREHFLYW